MDGRCLATYNPYSFALGVKTVTWSSSSQFLAIGSYDEKVSAVSSIAKEGGGVQGINPP